MFEPTLSPDLNDRYLTFLEMTEADSKELASPDQYLPSLLDSNVDKNGGKCSVCDAWSFTSKTEKLRHMKLVQGRTTTGPSNKSTAVFTCNHEGCGRKFSSYHFLYQHKKKKVT